MCLAPWYVLSLVAGGKVMPCCSCDPISAAEVLEGQPLGPGSDATPLDMVNTPVMIGVRQRMLEGKPVSGCETCRLAEAAGPGQPAREARDADRRVRGQAGRGPARRRPQARCHAGPAAADPAALAWRTPAISPAACATRGYSSRVASDAVMSAGSRNGKTRGSRTSRTPRRRPRRSTASARDLVRAGDTHRPSACRSAMASAIAAGPKPAASFAPRPVPACCCRC